MSTVSTRAPQRKARRRRIGPYQLERCLGAGAFARVYAAVRHGDGAWVAVKVIPAGTECADTVRQRLLVEGHLALGIDHPNLVRYLDVGEEAGAVYVVQELLDGGDITALLTAHRGRVPPETIARVGRDAARGLHELHSCGLLHRDVKPANLLLTRDGVCKVADLGLARPLGEKNAITAEGLVVGTPSFIAPEQIRSDPRLDGRADVYGLAASLYWLATGRTPHVAQNLWTMLSRAVHDPFPDPRLIRPDLPEGLVAVIQAAGDKELCHRHPSAAVLADDLDDVLAGRMPRLASLAVERRPAMVAMDRDSAPSVLMVGGDPLFRRLYVGRLTVDGWQVVSAMSQSAIVSICQHRRPAVVLFSLPQADMEPDAIGEIRALSGMGAVPIVGLIGEEGCPATFQAGFTRVVDRRTTSPRELSLLLRRLLVRVGRGDELALPVGGLTHAVLDRIRPLLGDLEGPLQPSLLEELAVSARSLASLAITVEMPAAAAIAEAVEILAQHLGRGSGATLTERTMLNQTVDALIAVITAQHPGPVWPPRQILVLEGDPLARRLAQLAIARARLRSRSVCDVRELLRLAETQAPSLILADVRRLPEPRDLVIAIRRCSAAPMVLTAPPDVLAGLPGGPGIDRLARPFSAAELTARIMINLVLPAE